jgi:glycosyltransferase involved in cell wall biosynthesis
LSKTVSVVIPAHNAADTIAQAIVSVREQTVRADETVVACDGCTDGTAQIAKDAGAVVVEIPKANGSVARNAGAKAAKGEVYFFLDADDWWEPEKIERHLAVWSGFSGSVVMDRSTPWNPDGSRSYWTGGLDHEGPLGWEAFLSHRAWPSGSGFSVLRECYHKVGGFNEGLNKFQDVDFWIRASHACGPIYTMRHSLTNYRLSCSPTVSKTTALLERNLQVLFEGWPFASEEQKAGFRSHSYLMAAEVTPWPASVAYFRKAHWPVGKRFFWKSLFHSLRAQRSA